MDRSLAVVVAVALLAVGTARADSLVDGIRLFEEGQHAEARELLLTRVESDEQAGTACHYVGRSHFEEGDFEEAIRWFERAIEREPAESEHHRWLGRSYAEQAGKVSILRKGSLASGSRKALLRAVELRPSNLEARRDLITFYVNAPRVVGGSRSRAVEQADEIKRRDPYLGHLAWAAVHQDDGAFDAAQAEYRAAIELSQRLADPYYGLGYLQQHHEQFEAAYSTFRDLLDRFPDEMGAVYQIGRIGALSGGHLAEAAVALERYLDHEPGPDEPSLADAGWRLGMVYSRQGRTDLARRTLEAAIRMEPKHKEARRELEQLK